MQHMARERGLALGVIDTVPGLYRKAVITAPDGTIISLGEDLSTHPLRLLACFIPHCHLSALEREQERVMIQ